jgi:hypothetical protein
MAAVHSFESKGYEREEGDEQEERPLFLTDFLEKLVGSKARADVIFIIGDSKNGGEREIPAHRVVLAASSKLFEAMLFPPRDDNGERPKVKLPMKIRVTETSPEAFLSFLQCIYTDEVEIDPTQLADLIKLSHKYQIEKLQLLCSEFMEKDVTVDNACELFEMAPKLLGDEEFGLPFIRENMTEVLASPAFLKLSRPRLEYLIKDDALAADESAIFKGVLEWAKVEATRQGFDSKGDSKGDEKINELVKDFLPHIRFPLMTMEDIVSLVQPTNLLDQKQLLELFQYVALSDDEKDKKKLDFNATPRSGGKKLKFSSILDTNGLIYFIGTDGGKTPYNNPIKSGKVVVKLSSTGGGSPVEHLADRNPSSYAVENSYGLNEILGFRFCSMDISFDPLTTLSPRIKTISYKTGDWKDARKISPSGS